MQLHSIGFGSRAELTFDPEYRLDDPEQIVVFGVAQLLAAFPLEPIIEVLISLIDEVRFGVLGRPLLNLLLFVIRVVVAGDLDLADRGDVQDNTFLAFLLDDVISSL